VPEHEYLQFIAKNYNNNLIEESSWWKETEEERITKGRNNLQYSTELHSVHVSLLAFRKYHRYNT
jgi:hypothetical protein